MIVDKKRKDLSDKIRIALGKGIVNLIAETKAKNSYIVVSGKDGKVKKIPAKDL